MITNEKFYEMDQKILSVLIDYGFVDRPFCQSAR